MNAKSDESEVSDDAGAVAAEAPSATSSTSGVSGSGDLHADRKAAIRNRLKGRKAQALAAGADGAETKTVVKAPNRTMGHQIPLDILEDPLLKEAMKVLPANYEFEIPKTLWRIRTTNAKMVALQFPEGLLLYSCVIAGILERFGKVETLIMGDVTYGACCVDDFSARALGCDLLVHYGHSCLVPIDVSQMNMLYVFVDIKIDVAHLVDSLKHHFPSETRMVLAGTVQFASSMMHAYNALHGHYPHLLVPQAKPLSRM